jgi:hypothetical protein
MKTIFENPQMQHELERIQGYDKPVIKKDSYFDNELRDHYYTIEAGDNTILYENATERDKDFNTLKEILKPTEVVFRAFNDRDGKQVIALFPYVPGRTLGSCESYMHIGQHSEVDYQAVIDGTRPATPEEYADLKAELENYGPEEAHYNLKVIKFWNKNKHMRAYASMRKSRNNL